MIARYSHQFAISEWAFLSQGLLWFLSIDLQVYLGTDWPVQLIIKVSNGITPSSIVGVIYSIIL